MYSRNAELTKKNQKLMNEINSSKNKTKQIDKILDLVKKNMEEPDTTDSTTNSTSEQTLNAEIENQLDSLFTNIENKEIDENTNNNKTTADTNTNNDAITTTTNMESNTNELYSFILNMSDLGPDMGNKTNVVVKGFYDADKKDDVLKMWTTLISKGYDTKLIVEKLFWFIKLL